MMVLKALIAVGVAVVLGAGIFFFVIPVNAIPEPLQGLRKASLPECKQENSGLRVGDMYCNYKYLGAGNGYWEWRPIPAEQKIPADAQCMNKLETRIVRNADGTTTRFSCVNYKWVPN